MSFSSEAALVQPIAFRLFGTPAASLRFWALKLTMPLPDVKALLSDEHFLVDGTLIQAWASMKSFRRKDGTDEPPAPGRNGERNFRGETRSSETHASTTDPDAQLARKSDGNGAKLAYLGHLLMENRNGLVVDARLTHATGTAEPEAALDMLKALRVATTRRASIRTTTGRASSPQPANCVSPRMSPCRPEHHRPSRVEHRWTDDAACRLSAEPGNP